MLKFDKETVVGVAKVEKQINEYDVSTIIITGFEGGCSYWMGVDNTKPEWKGKPKDEPLSTWATKILVEGGTLYLYEVEDSESEVLELTLNKLLDGIAMNVKERPHDSDLENGDATTADCIIQYAVFGKLVYG